MEKKREGVSRQTLWQRKHRAMGLCVVCSEPAYKGWRCVKHYEQHKIVMRLRYIPRVRGRYDVGGSLDLSAPTPRSGMTRVGGGPFGPLPPAPVAPTDVETKPAAAPRKKASPSGKALEAKRNKPKSPRAKKKQQAGARAGGTRGK